MSNTKTKKIIKQNALDFYQVIDLIDNNLDHFKNGLIKLTLNSSHFSISKNVIEELKSTGLSVNLEKNSYIITIPKNSTMSVHEFLYDHVNHLDSYGKIFKHRTWKLQLRSLCFELSKNPIIKDNLIFWNVENLNLYYPEIFNYFKSFNFIFNIKENKIYLKNNTLISTRSKEIFKINNGILSKKYTIFDDYDTDFSDLQNSDFLIYLKYSTSLSLFLQSLINNPNLIFDI